MKKYSIEATELLSKAEKFEIKAGEDFSQNNSDGGCGVCQTCVACATTCTACTTRAMDVVFKPFGW